MGSLGRPASRRRNIVRVAIKLDFEKVVVDVGKENRNGELEGSSKVEKTSWRGDESLD
jgi:hypothetical protein